MKYLGNFIFIFIYRLQLQAQLWYKIHIFNVDHTKITTSRRKKGCKFYRPERVHTKTAINLYALSSKRALAQACKWDVVK